MRCLLITVPAGKNLPSTDINVKFYVYAFETIFTVKSDSLYEESVINHAMISYL